MKVCIAEKPSVAKEIAYILGAKERKDGYFQGNGYQVTWTFGHLCTLKEPQDYAPELKKWNIYALPIIPPRFGIKLIGNKGVKKQFDIICKLVGNAKEVINCGDAGQEGELIQRWVLQKAMCDKPIKRLWISSLTAQAIREGFQKLKDNSEFDRLYWAGSSRAIGDWLLGINATRAYTIKYGGYGNLLSIGRVQTPTLAMIVKRYQEIENFVSKPFWELKTKYREVVFSCVKGKFQKKETATTLLERIRTELFTIISFEKKNGKESAPKLFDLTSLQVECNKKLNLSADETLKTAQSLYERKYLTYPRVDTRYLSEDLYPSIEGVLRSMTDYKALVQALLGKAIRKSKGVFDNKKVTDHHAIIPTNMTAQGLSSREKAVYDIVAKRFIANFYPDCKVSKTTVIGEVTQEKFKATGKQIIDPGWRQVYGQEPIDEEDGKSKKEEQEAHQLLPEFKEGEQGPHAPYIEEKQTSPPKLYTEATLLRAMETAGKQVEDAEVRELMKENGIGRPSTRANIIETLFKRKYVSKRRKSIVPTTAGVQLIDTLENDLLKSAELTGKWEKQLRQIETGQYDVHLFMKEMKQMVTGLIHEVRTAANVTKIIVEEKKNDTKTKKAKTNSATNDKTSLSCPKCKQGVLLKGKAAHGCSHYKKGCDFTIPFVFMEKKLSEKQLIQLVNKGKSPLIKGFQQEGEKVEGHIVLEENLTLSLQVKEKGNMSCPKCRKGTIIKGRQAYGCDQYREGCRFVVPFRLMQKELNESQTRSLIEKGKTPLIKNLIRSEGDTVQGRLVLNEQFQVVFVAKD